MGYALAEQARALGAKVILISGPTVLTIPNGVNLIAVETTNDMREAVKVHFAKADCLIMAAAPSDYRPHEVMSSKIKRTAGELTLELEPTEDILKEVTLSRRKGQIVVGFALETNDAIANARRKLKEKNLDLIVLNQPGPDSGFGTDTNRVTVIAPRSKPVKWPLASKEEIAHRLLELIGKML